MLIVFFALGLMASLTSNAATSPNCTPIRQAAVKIEVYRMHWDQNGGNYQIRDDKVCSVNAQIGVLGGPAGGCTSANTAECQVEIDGVMHKLNVAASIYHNSDPAPNTKRFSLWYHLDRNSGAVTTGEAGSTNIFTSDLGLKKIGLSLQSKFDSPIAGTVTRDGIRVVAEFEDQNAP